VGGGILRDARCHAAILSSLGSQALRAAVGHNERLLEKNKMSVGEICNREVVVIDRAASVYEAARMMRNHHVGSLVVVDVNSTTPKRPVGIVTDRDLVVEIMAKEVPESVLTTGDIIAPELLTAREADGVWETIMRMRAMGVRRLPVVDTGGNLSGMLTMDDLLKFIADELSDLVRLVRREQKREKDIRPPA
jgi:CBS-domain-containing membrane protein